MRISEVVAVEESRPSEAVDMKRPEEQPIIGWIEYPHSGEKTGYNDADAYIKALRKAFEENPNGFAYHTMTTDAAVRMEADRLSYNLFGGPLPYGLDDYGRFSEGHKAKGYLVDKDSGEKEAFYESDEYVFRLAERLRSAKDKGSVAFFTATDNTAVRKAADDAIRKEFELTDAHALEHCIHRPPMEKAMCVREYVSRFLSESERQWIPGTFEKTERSAGWIRGWDDGERLYFDDADGFIKELKLELALHPGNMDFGVLKDEAAVHKAVFDVTGDASREGNPFYIDELGKDAPDSVKGRILNLETGGLTEYRRSEDYLAAVEERLILSPDQFSFETVTDNSAVWKELDDHVRGAAGFFDRNGIEKSLSRPKVTGFVTLSEYLNQRIWTDAKVQAKQTAVQSGMDRGRNRDEATKKMMRAAKAVPQEKSRDMVKVKTSKKRSVLARLAEKQQIVKDRENAKHMGKIYPQHEHGTEDLPFPEAVKKTASKIPRKER